MGSTFGEDLRRERELREISLQEIAEATKISIRFLQAIEENNFDVLPGGIFNIGFIRAYANYIGVDDDEKVNNYLFYRQQLEERKEEAAAKKLKKVKGEEGARSWLRWLLLGGVAVVAIGVAAWLLFFYLSVFRRPAVDLSRLDHVVPPPMADIEGEAIPVLSSSPRALAAN